MVHHRGGHVACRNVQTNVKILRRKTGLEQVAGSRGELALIIHIREHFGEQIRKPGRVWRIQRQVQIALIRANV